MWVKIYDSIFQEVCFLLQEMTIVHKEYGSFKPVKTALESRNIFLEIVDKMTVKGNNGKSDNKILPMFTTNVIFPLLFLRE